MSIYYTVDKTPVQVELKPFASGGEGEVFRVITAIANLSTQCAKIYFPNKRTREREEKIKFMIQNTSIQQQNSRFLLCLPTKILFDKKGMFVGFLMPTAFNGSIQLYELVTTQISKKIPSEWHQKYDRSTKLGIENRLKLCTNIAIAIHKIHKTGNIVLVDFKPQNILITNDAKVSIIDLDSVQISNGRNVIYPAKVNTPEYTPKEAYILNPSIDYIPETWDRFSLAVVFYEILFGIHPYTSTAGGQYTDITTISEKISNNLFVHGSKRIYLTIIPAIHKNYEQLPYRLKQLFLLAFELGSQTPINRPSAESWGQEITEELRNFNVVPNKIEVLKNSNSVHRPSSTGVTIKPANNKNSNGLSTLTVVIVLLCICMIAIIIANNESSKHEKTAIESINTIDTISTVLPQSSLTDNLQSIQPDDSLADAIVIPIDTNYTLETNQSQPIDLNSSHSAKEISYLFLYSLGISDCKTAWYATYNEKWDSKGIDWFCSVSAYGGVHKVVIKQLYEVSNNEYEAIIHTEYYAEDSFNGNGNYSQNFILKKIQSRWYIVEIKNVR